MKPKKSGPLRSAGSCRGTSPVAAVCLLLAITAAMAGLLGWSLLRDGPADGSRTTEIPEVSISVENIYGGLVSDQPPVRFQDNGILVKHRGGPDVPLKDTSIFLTAQGNAFQGIPGSGGTLLTGRLSVHYVHLGPDGKNKAYAARNEAALADGYFSAGEVLILRGNDSAAGNRETSLVVTTDNGTKTSDNFGLKTETLCLYAVFLEKDGRKILLAQGERIVCARQTAGGQT